MTPWLPFLCLHKWMFLATTLIGLPLNPTPLTSSGLCILPTVKLHLPCLLSLPLSRSLSHTFFFLLQHLQHLLPHPRPQLMVCFLHNWENRGSQIKSWPHHIHPPTRSCAQHLALLPVIRQKQLVLLSRTIPSWLTLGLQAMRSKGRSPRWKLQVQPPSAIMTSSKWDDLRASVSSDAEWGSWVEYT